MTVDDDEPDGDVLSSLSNLRRPDVSRSRARRLRQRCHAVLQAEPRSTRAPFTLNWASARRVVVPALGAAWCLAYLVEIARCTVAVYAYFGTQ